MKKFFLFLIVLFSGFLSLAQVSQAKIYIYVDQPGEKRFPIAVPDFLSTQGKDSQNFSVKLAEILRNDLKLAGFFEVLDRSRYPENPGSSLTAEQINFHSWKNTTAQALIKAGFWMEGNQLLLQMRLFDTETGQMLVGKEYRIESKNYRKVIHRFTDEVLLALTGEKGPFSTQITVACGRVGKREIYLIDADGENRTAVTKNNSINLSPTWSPDLKQIAYVSFANYFPQVFISSADGKGKAERITSTSNGMNYTPAWSPDGQFLAYSSSVSGDPEIYLMNLQTKQSTPLTKQFGIDLAPAWSPDGKNIVFSSERGGSLQIFSMDRSGGGVRRLTYQGSQNDQPDWSPKGDRIAYSSREAGRFEIYSMNPDGSSVQRLTSGGGSNESPSFSPDGRYVVYTSNRNNRSDVYLMLWNGGNQTRITQTGDCVNPDWSPKMEN